MPNDELNVKPLIEDISSVLASTLIRLGLGDSRLQRTVQLTFDEQYNFKVKFKEYAHYIDTGRRRGAKPPPIKPILEFIDRKGISPTNISKLQLAYAISNSIANNGIQPRPFLDRLHEEVTKLVEIHIFIELEKQIINIFNN